MTRCTHKSFKIPLEGPAFEGINREELQRKAKTSQHDERVRGAVAAIIDMYQKEYGESILENGDWESLRWTIDATNEKINLVLTGVPKNSLQKRTTTEGDFDSIIPPHVAELMLPSLMRDILTTEPYCGPIDERKTWLKSIAKKTGLLDSTQKTKRGYPRTRSFFQGGHSIPHKEYTDIADFSHSLVSADLGTELGTGCGDGTMQAPFNGAISARRTARLTEDMNNIGLTEIGILAKEAPNPLLTTLLTAPDIESRMELFIRLHYAGFFGKGGSGTIEELMTAAGVFSHPNNQDIDYPLYLVEKCRKGEISYMKRLDDFLNTCFGDKLSRANGKPLFTNLSTKSDFSQSVNTILEDRKRRGFYKKNECIPSFWNDEIYYPEEIGIPFEPTFEAIEKIDLSQVTSKEDSYRLAVELRRAFSAVVHWTVKDPHGFEGWNGDRPKLQGDPVVMNAFHDLTQAFMREGRIKMSIEEGNPDAWENYPYQIPRP